MKLAEDVADRLLEISDEPELPQIPLPVLIALIAQILQALVPLLEQWCKPDPDSVRGIAEELRPCVGMGLVGLLQFPIATRWRYRLFRRQFRSAAYDVTDDGIRPQELEAALLDVAQSASDSDIAELRGL